ncbi:helix-turn-helix domain-containing protein [Pseudogemmobacter humi]|uniref:HTH-type transcriptional regulator PuuR n=1 Tax=Pseudogemmobacter humi TaxID=2483812 RepID=A0A3P5XQH1_9RHOB|nr:XRE family transcriptional regulator [Pseudogemmobacter humi]VDC33925.1 HTH-type transcriptional regulator PuuR [Pseudogemmobacter humi]
MLKQTDISAQGQAAAAKPESDAASPAAIGSEIRDLRKAKRLTIKALSEATGISIGHLSEIERGISSPSIKALHDIARALGVTIGWFLHNAEESESAERRHIVRAGNRRSLRFSSGVADELLSPNLRGQLELLMSRFPPGAVGADVPYNHTGEEAGIVLSGALEMWIGDECFLLAEGDSFAFPSTTPHRYRNPGETEAVVIWAITPPSY